MTILSSVSMKLEFCYKFATATVEHACPALKCAILAKCFYKILTSGCVWYVGRRINLELQPSFWPRFRHCVLNRIKDNLRVYVDCFPNWILIQRLISHFNRLWKRGKRFLSSTIINFSRGISDYCLNRLVYRRRNSEANLQPKQW